MKEEFLHFLWRTRRYDAIGLTTTTGDPVTVLHAGEWNPNAGPDFLHAKVQIGDTLWAGNVEMHLRASEWLRHGHDSDRAYDNVVLHVVLEEDEQVRRKDGSRLACLELNKRIPATLVANYQRLMHNEHWIPCQHFLYQVPESTRNLWLDRVLVDRLEEKTQAIESRLQQNTGDWEETLYQLLARNFGFKINDEPFDRLASSLPLLVLTKHCDQPLQVEALLMGQAGLLSTGIADEYVGALNREYDFLRKKYKLEPLATAEWKFLRLRPANFPTIRVAQFAALMSGSTHLFSRLLEARRLEQVSALFRTKLPEYWLTHYMPGKPSPRREKPLGQQTVQLIVVNTVVPLLFLYGKLRGEPQYRDRALELLEALPAEKNSIIGQWQQLGMKPRSAYQTQALLQLKNKYCARHLCLQCGIGSAVLR
jgi:hypothetical protein